MLNQKPLPALILATLSILFFSSIVSAAGNISLPQPNKQCDKNCVQHIQTMLDSYRQANNIPGIQLTISLPQQPMQTFCSGTITKNGETPINKDTKFEIASNTKSFTAAIALQLEAQNKFNLNDKIGKWFSQEYPAWQDNTIGDLLNMTSTIGDYFDGDNGKFQAVYEKNPTHIWTAKEITDWVYHNNQNCTRSNKQSPFCALKPGQGWSYSNTNYILLERIIAQTTNQSLQTLMYQRIFKPLQMASAIYRPEQNPLTIKNFAHAYNNDPKSSAYGKDVTNYSLSSARAAGAIIATTEDLAKWVRGLFDNKILSSQQMTKMLTSVCVADNKDCQAGQPIPKNSPQPSYSSGLLRIIDPQTKEIIWAHIGGSEGQASIFVYDPQSNLVVTIAQNMTPTSQSIDKIASAIMRYFGLALHAKHR